MNDYFPASNPGYTVCSPRSVPVLAVVSIVVLIKSQY